MFLLLAAVEHANPIFAFFENNLFNWLLLIGLLFVLGNKFLPSALASRKSAIETALNEARQARAEGLAFLEAQQQKVANAEKEAEKILVEARGVAEQMRQQMEAQTEKDAAEFAQKIEQQIAQERQLAITQLRSAAARAAITLTEAILPRCVTDAARGRLLDQFLEQLEGTRK